MDVNQTAAEMNPPESPAARAASVDARNSRKAARFNGLVGVVLQILVIKADQNTFNNERFWLQVCVPGREITTFTTAELIHTLQKCLCVGTFTQIRKRNRLQWVWRLTFHMYSVALSAAIWIGARARVRQEVSVQQQPVLRLSVSFKRETVVDGENTQLGFF